MNKVLAMAVLVFAILAISFATSGPNATAGPRVVAKVNLTNQTMAIPTTTIFTPPESGLYRASAYMTMTTSVNSGSYWTLPLNWTDDSGGEQAFLSELPLSSTPPGDYGISPAGDPNCTIVFRALAGTPVTYYVYGGPGGTYALFITIERLD